MLFDVLAPVGQRTLHHKSDVLETVVLVNPSEDTVALEVRLQDFKIHLGKSSLVQYLDLSIITYILFLH